jgi:hypothetical protein
MSGSFLMEAAAAAAAYKDTEGKTANGASKADMVFAQIR